MSKQASLEAEPSMSVIVKDGWPIPETITTVAGSEKLPDGVYELYIATPAPSANVDELTMWVKRLAHSLGNAKPDSKLSKDAMSYLNKKGLISVEDILR